MWSPVNLRTISEHFIFYPTLQNNENSLDSSEVYIWQCSVQNQARFHIEICHFLGVNVTRVIFPLLSDWFRSSWFIKGKLVCDFRNFFRLIPNTNYCRKNIFQGVLVPLYLENLKLGQSDKRGDIDPEKVTNLNMICSLVLNTAIYMAGYRTRKHLKWNFFLFSDSHSVHWTIYYLL